MSPEKTPRDQRGESLFKLLAELKNEREEKKIVTEYYEIT